MANDIFEAQFCGIKGDISRMDAIQIAKYARRSANILEFGVGGSSYLIHQNAPNDACVTHLDTSDEWVQRVETNLDIIRKSGKYDMPEEYSFNLVAPGDTFDKFKDDCYDFIYNDGLNTMREDFGLALFPSLAIGGVMMFHDCRSKPDFQQAMTIVDEFFLEIDNVEINIDYSNMVVIHKGVRQEYYNWNEVESHNHRISPFS